MVYIRIKADISALTYPNKRPAVCYPASNGGGAAGGGGDRGGRMNEKRQIGQEQGVLLQCHRLLISSSIPEGENSS